MTAAGHEDTTTEQQQQQLQQQAGRQAAVYLPKPPGEGVHDARYDDPDIPTCCFIQTSGGAPDANQCFSHKYE
jgi:hypothetical protein